MKKESAPFEGGEKVVGKLPLFSGNVRHRGSARIRTWLNYSWEDLQRGERNSGISQTVPNQAMSIRQIFERYAMGKPIPHNGMQFTGDETIDISRMDKTEVAQFRLDLKNRIDELRANLKSQKSDYYARLVDEAKKAEELAGAEAQSKELEARIKNMKSEKSDGSGKEDNKSLVPPKA